MSAATWTIRSQIRRIPVESSAVRLPAHASRPNASTRWRARSRLSLSASRIHGALAMAGSRCGVVPLLKAIWTVSVTVRPGNSVASWKLRAHAGLRPPLGWLVGQFST